MTKVVIVRCAVRAKTGMNKSKSHAAIESFWRRRFVINDVFVAAEFVSPRTSPVKSQLNDK